MAGPFLYATAFAKFLTIGYSCHHSTSVLVLHLSFSTSAESRSHILLNHCCKFVQPHRIISSIFQSTGSDGSYPQCINQLLLLATFSSVNCSCGAPFNPCNFELCLSDTKIFPSVSFLCCVQDQGHSMGTNPVLLLRFL